MRDKIPKLRLAGTPPSPKTVQSGGQEGFLPDRFTRSNAFQSQIVALLLTGRLPFWLTRRYLVDWKGTLPIKKVNVLF
jgi:hypothetical protein